MLSAISLKYPIHKYVYDITSSFKFNKIAKSVKIPDSRVTLESRLHKNNYDWNRGCLRLRVKLYDQNPNPNSNRNRVQKIQSNRWNKNSRKTGIDGINRITARFHKNNLF